MQCGGGKVEETEKVLSEAVFPEGCVCEQRESDKDRDAQRETKECVGLAFFLARTEVPFWREYKSIALPPPTVDKLSPTGIKKCTSRFRFCEGSGYAGLN